MIGQTLLKSTTEYVTRPEACRALNGIFAVNVRNLESSATLDIAIESRARESTTWTQNTTFTQINATGIHEKEATGLSELVRLKLTVGGTQAYSFVHVALLPTRYYAAS